MFAVCLTILTNICKAKHINVHQKIGEYLIRNINSVIIWPPEQHKHFKNLNLDKKVCVSGDHQTNFSLIYWHLYLPLFN